MIECNFNTLTDKERFQIILSGELINFGYIPSSKRRAFISYLENTGFLIFAGHAGKFAGYNVLREFAYETLSHNRPYTVTIMHATINTYMYIELRKVPNTHTMISHSHYNIEKTEEK